MTSISASLPDLIQALRSGQWPLSDYLSQLETRFAEREPGVLAFMPEPDRWGRLRREAEALLARYPDPAARPALFGIPVGVKDIFHVDGLPTTGGSRLPPEVLAGPQAESVTRLRAAGALVLGKTVSTEFAYFGPGPTRNPRSPAGTTHTPGGSSSGSAAAVAAGLCPLALGTQTIGSIIRPASFCGVVGFKPSYERVSRAGVIPLSASLDHVGVFAADVAGVRLAAEVLAGDWRRETERAGRPVLGVPEGPYLEAAEPEMLAHFRSTVQRLAGAGYVVKSVPALPDFAAIEARHDLLMAAEAAQVHADWYARFRDRYHPRTAELIERGRAAAPDAVEAARAGREQLRGELTALMDVHGLEVWLAPAAPGPAPAGLESTGRPVMNLPWTHAGLPVVGLPSGRAANGLPLGLQLIGRWRADEPLLVWAEHIEGLLNDTYRQ